MGGIVNIEKVLHLPFTALIAEQQNREDRQHAEALHAAHHTGKRQQTDRKTEPLADDRRNAGEHALPEQTSGFGV